MGAGGAVGSGAVMGAGGAVGAGGTAGTNGAGSGGCPPDLDSNPKHCGRCYRDCEGGECSNGVCKPVKIANADRITYGASALALDDSYVYWARPIMRVSKMGGTPELLSSDVPDAVWGIAVGDSHVFWGGPSYGPVRRVVKIGGASQALTLENVGADHIAVDSSGVYFTSKGVYHMHHDGSGLRKLTPEGDAGIAIDDDFVYFTSHTKNELYRMTKDGLDLTLLAAAPLPREVAQYGDFVVFAATGDGSVRRVPKRGGPMIAIGSATCEGLAADEDGVYCTTGGSGIGRGSVVYVPIEGLPGGLVRFLAEAQHEPRSIATDDTRIFWTSSAPGSAVVKLVKPVDLQSSGTE